MTKMIIKAHSIEEQLVSWRRDFHMHPELGFQETRTSSTNGLFRSVLQSWQKAR
jgi:metal-dependent amidase/aminoacylase/carboxypeptidase family protein